MKKNLTIFTPTYNRAYCLKRLYDSLCHQTCKSFEWLVVDDGSNDNTRELIDSWIKEGKIEIRYLYQENSGKSMAHNEGVRQTQTELFFCVDSDDMLTPNAIEIIQLEWSKTTESNTGLLLQKFDLDSNIVVTKIPAGLKESTLYDAYNKYGLLGDSALVFRSSAIKQFEMPHFEGEKFVPENYLYDLVDTLGTLIIVRTPIYMFEYLNDGYTGNMMKLLKKNPRGYIAYINQRLRIHDKSIKTRFYDSARYVAIMLTFDAKNIFNKATYPLYTLFALPLGWMLYVKKYKNI